MDVTFHLEIAAFANFWFRRDSHGKRKDVWIADSRAQQSVIASQTDPNLCGHKRWLLMKALKLKTLGIVSEVNCIPISILRLCLHIGIAKVHSWPRTRSPNALHSFLGRT